MKFKRIIRFEDDYEKEEIKQENSKKSKKDISSNNDILLKEDLQGLFEDDQESQENFLYNASDELERCIEKVASGRASNNMIGVFGLKSDVVTQNVCLNLNLREMRDNIIFVGQVDYSSSLSDIYNSIAAIFFNYIKSNYANQYDMQYYVREAMMALEKVVYNDSQYYYDDPLESLNNMSRKFERDKSLLSAINIVKQIINSSLFSRNRDPKFLVTIEMENFDYKVLSSLTKLNSSDLILIVFSMLDFNLASRLLSNSIGGSDYCMDKFFGIGNYVIAGANET